MMKKAFLLTGVPGTGKTHLMKAILHTMDQAHARTTLGPLVEAMCATDMPTVMGIYDDSTEVFQGCDRWSMAVSPEFKKLITDGSLGDFLMEGDRLVSNSIIDFLQENGYDVKVIVLEANPDLLQARYKARGSNQSETFLKSKATKVGKISSRMDMICSGEIECLPHETPEHTRQIVKIAMDFFK